MSFLLILFLSVWLLASGLAQFRHNKTANWLMNFVRWLKRKDYCSLIPSWWFFAPNTGWTDYHLLYRDKLCDSQYTPWKEIQFPSNRLFSWIWNPDKRREKAIVDMSLNLLRMAIRNPGNPSKEVYISVPYISLLTYVSGQPRSLLSDYTQFMIVVTFGDCESRPNILFISPLHRL